MSAKEFLKAKGVPFERFGRNTVNAIEEEASVTDLMEQYAESAFNAGRKLEEEEWRYSEYSEEMVITYKNFKEWSQ